MYVLTSGFAPYKGYNVVQGSIASHVKRLQRAPRQASDSVRAAMLVDDLREQKVEEKDFQIENHLLSSRISK